MSSAPRPPWQRRDFLKAATGLFLGATWAHAADEAPTVANPRATSGDHVEPKWDDKLTLTVGQSKADLVGSTDKVLQAAVDYVARLGGGTVQVLPGTYRLRNAVYLASGVRLLGSGEGTVLFKEPSHSTKLAQDSDWFDQEITLADAKGFQIGDGICLRTRNPHNGSTTVAKRTLVARSGNRFKLDKALRENFWLVGDTTVSALYPILSGELVRDVAIQNLTLDGNRKNNDNLDGNYAGCIFLQDCNHFHIRQVHARDYNGDGISWQICHDVLVEHCVSAGHAGLGLHPGSGSQRPIMRNNRLRDNDIGLFFCWGVKNGLAEKNVIEENRSYGISIGHRDTDNLIRDNTVRGSGKVGVLFRAERGKAFAPHRNRLENNRIFDSGPDTGVAVDVQGETESITLTRNEIRESRQPMARIGVRIGKQTKEVNLVDNTIEGFATAVADLRK
jgi:Right handed beta helix region